MDSIAIIPARGGSKGIPDKNLQTVGGESLISRAVRTCLLVESISTAYVSTDSDSIAEEAMEAGATVIMRPAELSRDDSSSEEALIHALENMETSPKFVVFAQCTSPFTSSLDIQKAIEILEHKLGDVAFSVVANKHFVWEEGEEDGSLTPVGHPAHYRPRRQDLTSQFMETGNFYAFRSDRFLSARYRFHGVIKPVVIDDSLAIEIDDPHDLDLANALENLRAKF